jgi:uncharacterized protein YyaL (SSP411 family)
MSRPNRLINETSPYLLQHSGNPVDWYPWGDEALKKAREENKLLIISIGYAACHWCHVMEHECFSDEAVAELMNSYFVSVKVDREERPDIDSVYMSAVQALTGSGGWPLNVIALPDGRPVFGGTWFPKDKWMGILEQLHDYYSEHPEKTGEHADRLTAALNREEDSVLQGPEMPDPSATEDAVEYWLTLTDSENGGYHGAPKFPLPAGYNFLLEYHKVKGDRRVLDALTLTLNKISAGSIHDHLGGGFARYATDKKWMIPHFEKMLYDNAQLMSLFSNAYRWLKDELYLKTSCAIAGFVLRELKTPDNLFWSSLDADSEGEEGKYYTWEKQEFDEILGEDSKTAALLFGVTEDGNWEKNRNIIHLTESSFATDNITIPGTEITADLLDSIVSRLLAARSKRIRPSTDTKIITSWNALLIKGFADLYLATGDESILEQAISAGNEIMNRGKKDDGSLIRILNKGARPVSGFLDDYAFTAQAFLSLYRSTFDESWLTEALSLCEYAIMHFSNPSSDLLFYTSENNSPLIARPTEKTDNVMPSSNSVMAMNLHLLGRYFDKEEYLKRSLRMLSAVTAESKTGGPYYAVWDSLALLSSLPAAEIVVTGPEWKRKMKEINPHFLPHVLFAGGKIEGKLPLLKGKTDNVKTRIFVCKGKTCGLPHAEVHKALSELNSKG